MIKTEYKYKARKKAKISFRCPEHGLVQCYFMFSEEKKAVGIGCEYCYKTYPKLPVEEEPIATCIIS